MHISPAVALAGLFVGFTVGVTGMGGGALMTPLLVLLFKVQPLAAVSSDLVAAFVMKPVGAGVHLRRGTVNAALARWLILGSVPAAFAGVLVIRQLGNGPAVQQRVKLALGIALTVAAASIVAKAFLQVRRARTGGAPGADADLRIRRAATVLVGVIGGLVVGMTSVGSGSLVIVMLMALYPGLRSAQLVGTDLVQAIPLVGSAALGHLLFGDFHLDLTLSLLAGSIPGVYLGARLSCQAKDAVVRPVLALVLFASGLKLIGMGTLQVGLALLAMVVLALPVWGVLDASTHADDRWAASSVSKRMMIGLQGAGAPFGVGFLAAVLYFSFIRPVLAAAPGMPPPTSASFDGQASRQQHGQAPVSRSSPDQDHQLPV
jgi:uncharacterized membrane protein YfcA